MTRNKWHFALSMAGGLTASILFWSIAYVITSFIYAKLGKLPNGYLRQLIDLLFGFILLGSLSYIVSKFKRPKYVAVLESMLDAMGRIAKGDFNVNLNINPGPIVEIRELVDSINHMAGELNNMERMRQEFISNVSHEIQSPLTSIRGFARVLQTETLSQEERMHYLDIIETESRRLSKLSENLLKLTWLESEHHPFEPRRYRLDKQLRDIVLACEPQWVEKGIEIDISLEEVSVVADEDLMSQVWVNLINNSIKFTPQGGTIGISLHNRGSEVVVCISDTGPGIAEQDQAHIFERFYKADKSRNRSSGGSGLGLAIVKKIIDLHRGNISVQSVLGEGAEFTVSLPAATG
jgi:two-component system, OmpR family, phosphate regulon sensor histidine kinase PhoR